MWRCLPVILLLLFITPTLAQAQLFPGGPDQLVPIECRDPDQCGTCEFVKLTNNVIKFIIFFASIVAVLIFIYAGFRLVTSGGDTGALTKAKSTFISVIIGYVILLASFLIVDTLLRGLLPASSEGTSQILNWREIECLYPSEVRDELIAVDGIAGAGSLIIGGGGSGSLTGSSGNDSFGTSGGKCPAIPDPSNPCHPSNPNMIEAFGSRVVEASIICNKESGGAPIRSGSDLCCGPSGNCSGAPSFSGGYFQINILSEADKIPNCTPGAFYNKNGNNSIQGNCVRRNSKGICTGWSCSITNQNMYNECMKVTTNSTLNFDIAGTLFSARGFQPWANSADICEIPY